MKKITLQSQDHEKIRQLAHKIKRGDRNPYVTFVINDRHSLTLIGGESDSLIQITLPQIDKDFVPTGAWSISASAFAQLWLGQDTCIREKKPISFNIAYHKGQSLPTLEGVTEHHSFRYAEGQVACQHHLAFYDAITCKSFDTIPTHSAKELIKLADTHKPYQIFELTKEGDEVRIERDNDVIPFPLSGTLDIGFNIVLTPAATASLKRLTTSTNKEDLLVYLDDDQAIFSDGEQTFSHSQVSLREYREKQAQFYTQEAKIIVNHYNMKKELRAFKKIEEVHRANQALLFITPVEVYLATLPTTGSVMRLKTQQINTRQTQLYSVNINDLSKVKINDITNASQIKICVLKNTQGGLKLGFYNDKDKEFSYDSVPLELATSRIPELKRRIADAKRLDDGHFGEQYYLLDFNDV